MNRMISYLFPVFAHLQNEWKITFSPDFFYWFFFCHFITQNKREKHVCTAQFGILMSHQNYACRTKYQNSPINYNPKRFKLWSAKISVEENNDGYGRDIVVIITPAQSSYFFWLSPHSTDNISFNWLLYRQKLLSLSDYGETLGKANQIEQSL